MAAATAVVLFCSNVQFALFCALGVSYAGNFRAFLSVFLLASFLPMIYFPFPNPFVVMILHASFRKLTPAKQPTPAR